MDRQFGKHGWLPQRMNNLQGKTFLITGANSGIGFQAAKLLLGCGAKVIMLNRNEKKTIQAISDLKTIWGSNINLSFIKLNLASLQSVREAAQQILTTVPKIDALICNGAVGQVATQTLTADGFESQLGVNYYAYFLLTNLLFARIEESKGRIVFVSSEGYKLGLKTIQFDDMNFNRHYNANHAYSQSKLALMVFAYELQHRIHTAGLNTKVYVCHPGSSRTALIRKNAPLLTRLSWAIISRLPVVQSAERGAYPEVMCATEKNLKQRAFYGPTGFMQWSGPVGECTLLPLVFNQEWAHLLWTLSEKETRCHWNI